MGTVNCRLFFHIALQTFLAVENHVTPRLQKLIIIMYSTTQVHMLAMLGLYNENNNINIWLASNVTSFNLTTKSEVPSATTALGNISIIWLSTEQFCRYRSNTAINQESDL